MTRSDERNGPPDSDGEATYRFLFEAMDQGFCILEVMVDGDERPVDFRYLQVNPAFERQTGMADAVGRTIRELVPDIEQRWLDAYGAVARTGVPSRFENHAPSMGRWFDVYALRIGAPDARHVAVLFTDITARKEAEAERERLVAALEMERARLADVFRRAPSFIVAYRGPEHRYEFVNDAYYQLIGHRDVLGLPLLDALPEVRGQGFDVLLTQVRETGEPWVGRETPVQLQRTPGAPLETRYLDMVFQPLTEPDGSRSGVVAHGSDITEQVIARREVERLLVESERARSEAEAARAEAELASRAKGEFLAVMSHELRTPLNAIGGYAELLELGVRGPIAPQQREDLRRIRTSQRHLLGLINEVLNYARLEAGTVPFDEADVEVAEALAVAAELLAPQAAVKGITLAPPAVSPALVVRADADKLRQILLNLLTNAIKFTDRGGHVSLDADVGENATGQATVRIAVRDTGIGIPPDQLERVFEPFVQVRADLTRPNDGTGLGLAISRDLARAMHGDLTVHSTLRQGSTFLLVLPHGGAR